MADTLAIRPSVIVEIGLVRPDRFIQVISLEQTSPVSRSERIIHK